MNKLFLCISYCIVCAVGILFHFAYDYFQIDSLKAIFPSNESVFEHLKLFIFPSFLYMILDICVSKERKGIFSSYVSGNIVASIFLIASYYTYSGIIGVTVSYVNIALFFLCVAILFYFRYKKITLFDGANNVIAFVIFIFLIELFSFYPTEINLFSDPAVHQVLQEFPLNLFH